MMIKVLLDLVLKFKFLSQHNKRDSCQRYQSIIKRKKSHSKHNKFVYASS